MFIILCSCAAAYVLITITISSPPVIEALYTGSFQSNLWKFDSDFGSLDRLVSASDSKTSASVNVTFIVALSLRNVEDLKSKLQGDCMLYYFFFPLPWVSISFHTQMSPTHDPHPTESISVYAKCTTFIVL